MFSISKQDAVSWLRTIPDQSIDLVVTDPPYESLEKHRAKGTTTRLKISKGSSNAWFEVFPNDQFPQLFLEIYRVLKKNAHFYLFCDPETMFVAKPVAEVAGFTFWKPLIWDKKRIGMGYHYRSRYECILFFEKGKRKIADLGMPDILEVPRVFNGYPTEKPVELIMKLISQSGRPGEIVADPFMGSGSSGVAAMRSGLRFVGTDIVDSAILLTRGRLCQTGALETNDLDGLLKGDLPRLDSEVQISQRVQNASLEQISLPIGLLRTNR